MPGHAAGLLPLQARGVEFCNAPGVSAIYAGLPVFIIGVFTRRGVRMADVLTLEGLQGSGCSWPSP